MPEIKLENIQKVYDNSFVAVKGLNLHIQDGEFVVLVGPSGCGKSTVLRMIAGLEGISDGKLIIDGQDMTRATPKERKVAMVFQNYALYPHMTIYENLAFALKHGSDRLSEQEIDNRIQETSEIFKIAAQLTKKPAMLSGGQQQRVAVARSVVRKPDILLFDEPLSNLDAKLRTHMRVELIELHKKFKSTIVYVTHDQVEAMTMGEKICILKDGEKLQYDSPKTLYRRPANEFVATFIGSPKTNMFDVQLQKGKFHLLGKDFDAGLLDLKRADKARVGIRPEHFYYAPGKEQDKGYLYVEAQPRIIEELGHESIIHFQIGEDMFTVRLESKIDISENERVPLKIDARDILVFPEKD